MSPVNAAHHSQVGTVSAGMLGTGMSIMQVQSGHLGHLLASHEMDRTVLFSADLQSLITKLYPSAAS